MQHIGNKSVFFRKKTKYDIENSDRLTYNKDTSYYFNKMFFGIL